jgi:hypothetical protein
VTVQVNLHYLSWPALDGKRSFGFFIIRRTLNRNDAIARGAPAARRQFSPARRKLQTTHFQPTEWWVKESGTKVSGGPPDTAGQRPALPISTASSRFTVWCREVCIENPFWNPCSSVSTRRAHARRVRSVVEPCFNGIIPAEKQLPVLAGKTLELAQDSFRE